VGLQGHQRRCSCRHFSNADAAAAGVTTAAEHHSAVAQGEQRVVLTLQWMHLQIATCSR
jgi:hypothetical protein